MKHTFASIFMLAAFGICAAAAPKPYRLASPDGTLSAEITVGENVSYVLSQDGIALTDPCCISLSLADGRTLGGGKVKKAIRTSVDNSFSASVYKKSTVRDYCNELTLRFSTHDIVFRAYDNGLAYRFVSHLGGAFAVSDECAEFNFPEDYDCWVAYNNNTPVNSTRLEDHMNTSFEQTYTYGPVSTVKSGHPVFLPVAMCGPDGRKIVITESALYDFPGLFLYNPDAGNGLKGYHAHYPAKMEQGGHNRLQMLVKERENYIAKYDSDTKFPWRILTVSRRDAELLDNDLSFVLAPEQDPSYDFSYIKPGKVAWDWWNDWNLYGVDFRAGINNETYKYYIDFAAEHGIEYVILDEGWAVNLQADLMQVIPEINLKELVDYAADKGVGIILWAGYWAFERDMENVCRHYSEMGVKGFKVDFMDRDDQIMVDFYRRAAETAAKYSLVLDFHGAFKPVGLHRTYPNVLNYEGVHGLEQLKWSGDEDDQVTYDVTIPFIRMLAGPMDYTQGAMRNASRTNIRPVNSEGMSQGTRCRQLAEYIVFEAPLTMLCDSPSNYMREEECTRLIASVPTVWDETAALDGKISEYVAIARRSGDTWWIGAMTDWNARDIEISLDFLPEGEYTMTLFRDGINADRAARDYKVETMTVRSGESFKVHMAPGGGCIAKISL